MRLEFDQDELRELVRQILTEVLTEVDFPVARVTLDEAEAAEDCGVGRHVLQAPLPPGKIPTPLVDKTEVTVPAPVQVDFPPDGPQPGNLFWCHGQNARFQARPWQLLACVWKWPTRIEGGSRKKRVAVEDAVEEVWQGRQVADSTISSTVKRVNVQLGDLPFSMCEDSGFIVLGFLES